jgi:bromodomain-containing protein 8
MAPPSAPPTPTSPFPSSNTPQPSSLSRLTLSDKLLLAQAVHHIGSSPPDWGRVSSILLSHPLIRTKGRLEQASKAGITLGRIFGSRECERAWVALMRQYNLVLQPGEKEYIDGDASSTLANRAKEARGLPPKTDRGSQLALAQFLYAERIREIQESIKIKEQRFKALAADIEALNSGALDSKLSAEVTLINSQAVTPAADVSTRPPPKDRTGSATTPGGTSRRRPSRSESSAALPTSAQDEAIDGDLSISHDDSQDVDMTVRDESRMIESEVGDVDNSREEGNIEAEEEQDEDEPVAAKTQTKDSSSSKAAEEEKTTEPASKSTRSSARKRGSDAELKKRDADADESREEVPDEHDEGDGDVEMEDANQQKQAQPRRSRRAGRGVDDDVQTAVAPASAVASSTKNRLGALRSRETSGASPDGEEEGESVDVDTSRSTIDRGSRTSVSPVSVRKGRGTSRLSSNKATSRRSRGGSNTSRNEGEQLTEAEKERLEKEKAKRKNEKVLMMLLNEVSNHTHGNLFHSAIKEQDAPDYYTLIRHPMDIKTIKTRIKEGIIVNSVQLRRALNQMFANSLIYNRPGTEIHRMALEMRDSAEQVSLLD